MKCLYFVGGYLIFSINKVYTGITGTILHWYEYLLYLYSSKLFIFCVSLTVLLIETTTLSEHDSPLKPRHNTLWEVP